MCREAFSERDECDGGAVLVCWNGVLCCGGGWRQASSAVKGASVWKWVWAFPWIQIKRSTCCELGGGFFLLRSSVRHSWFRQIWNLSTEGPLSLTKDSLLTSSWLSAPAAFNSEAISWLQQYWSATGQHSLLQEKRFIRCLHSEYRVV